MIDLCKYILHSILMRILWYYGVLAWWKRPLNRNDRHMEKWILILFVHAVSVGMVLSSNLYMDAHPISGAVSQDVIEARNKILIYKAKEEALLKSSAKDLMNDAMFFIRLQGNQQL